MAKKTTTVIITGDHTGDIGTVITGATGTVHTGNGNVYNDDHDRDGQTFTGDGVTVIAGDNHDSISRRF